MKALLIAAFLLVSPVAAAQIHSCQSYEQITTEAKALWPELLGAFEGDAAQRILRELGINDARATLVEIYFDPADGTVVLIGFAAGCYRGHVQLPRARIDHFLRKS